MSANNEAVAKREATGAVLTRPDPNRTVTLKDLLARPEVKSSLAALVPRTMTPERLMKVAQSTVSRSPQLLQCDAVSLLKSLAVAAELGLDPSGTLGQGYLVPFNNRHTGKKEAQFIPGYRGLIALARRSGDIGGIHAEVVYAQDKFKIIKGIRPNIEHEPNYDVEPKDDDIVGAYAVAEFKDGTVQFDYMPRRDIDKTRKSSKASDDGPWKTWFSEMAKKTVVRRLCKYLPLRVEEPLAQAVELESRVENGEGMGELFTHFQALDAVAAPLLQENATAAEKAKSAMRSKTAPAAAKEQPEATPPAPAPAPAPLPAKPPVDREPGVDESADLDFWVSGLAQINTLKSLNEALAAIPTGWSDNSKRTAAAAVRQRIATVRASRGDKAAAGQASELFDGSPSASES